MEGVNGGSAFSVGEDPSGSEGFAGRRFCPCGVTDPQQPGGAAAKADALSERCRSLLPLLKSAVEGSSCNNKSSSKETCNKDKANGGLLDFESDDEGPVVELGK